MNELHWYIACTRSCQDRNVAAALSARVFGTFVAVRREIRQWSDRRKAVDRLLIPRIVFVRCTEQERKASLGQIPYLTHCLAVRLPLLGAACVQIDRKSVELLKK